MELIGTTSKKAVWKEYENWYYYGETSLEDDDTPHGKGLLIYKLNSNSLFESWWFNG